MRSRGNGAWDRLGVLMHDEDTPAVAQLKGLTLDNGWQVIETKEKSAHNTGANFSYRYVVKRDDEKGFVKAFDFSHAFAQKDTISALKLMTTAYEYERDILQICKERKLRKVVVAVDHGEVQVPGFKGIDGRVFYLVFHLADGDIRDHVRSDLNRDASWTLRVLKDVTTGLFQVHRQLIAHQDIKPSNVLLFGSEGRIADFGRASRRSFEAVHDEYAVAGDMTYAPPEQLYGFKHPDFSVRRFGCDLYMLGNLAAFLFTGINATAQLFARLDSQFHFGAWDRTYDEVLPYIIAAWEDVLGDLQMAMDPLIGTEGVALVRELCHPDLQKRGHPKGVGNFAQYSLERYVARLDLLSKRIDVRARGTRRTA